MIGFIREADAVVFIVSQKSILSTACAWEVEQVRLLNKWLAPVMLERVDQEAVPAGIVAINYLYFNDADRFEAQADRLSRALQTDMLWVVDGDKALIAFAEGIEYELIIASKDEHVHEGVLHVQNVNAYGRRFKQWLDRFNGVTTKYLQSYTGWRRWLEKGGCAIAPQTTLAAALG